MGLVIESSHTTDQFFLPGGQQPLHDTRTEIGKTPASGVDGTADEIEARSKNTLALGETKMGNPHAGRSPVGTAQKRGSSYLSDHPSRNRIVGQRSRRGPHVSIDHG